MNNNYTVDVLETTDETADGCKAVKISKFFTASSNEEAIKETDKALKTFKYLNAILYKINHNDSRMKIAWWADGKVEQT